MLVYLFLLVVVIVNVNARNLVDDEAKLDFTPYQNKKAANRPTEEIIEELETDYWKKNAIQSVNERIFRKIIKHPAKNVILFLGDGMSLPTIAAARVYLGGEEKKLSFEKFPYTGLSKTYCVDHQVPDSACSATAYLCGVKANLGTIGVGPGVTKENCTQMNNIDNHVDSIARQFQQKGKNSGLVTTTRVTHASPAGIYAHTASRDWESDTNVLKRQYDPNECEDIAHQLIFGDTGQNLNVILGGGRKKFLPKEIIDEEGFKGERSDHISLIEEWKNLREEKFQKAEYVWNKDQLFNVRNDTEYLLGLFESSHMKYNLERDEQTDPSLEEMTEAAIKFLQKQNKGYFLFVEGGRIDTAHHDSWIRKALDETAEFSKAVQKAVDLTKEEDTLIVVTSDHSHSMTYSGHAERGSDIFGYAGLDANKIPFTILNYANGPGYHPFNKDGVRYNPSVDEMRDINFRLPSNVPLRYENHGGDDVAVFARGPMAHLMTGVMEENVIPHLLAYASCVSNDINCDDVNKLP